MEQRDRQFGLRVYKVQSEGFEGWAVSGPARMEGKRWRRLFLTRETAEAFAKTQYGRTKEKEESADFGLNLADTSKSLWGAESGLVEEGCRRRNQKHKALNYLETPQDTRAEEHKLSSGRSGIRRNRRGKGRRWKISVRQMLYVTAIVFVAFLVDSSARKWLTASNQSKVMAVDFESHPLLLGWTASGQGADWTDEFSCSGQHSIVVRESNWSSPLVSSKPSQWYRLVFKSKAPGSISNVGSIGYGYCSIAFYADKNSPVKSHIYSSVFQSELWQLNEMRFRAPSLLDALGCLRVCKMKVCFTPIGAQPFFVDDVDVSETTVEEVGQWADSFYRSLPARLRYEPKSSRWQRIPATMKKLRTHERVRIVFLGDSIQQDLANSPIDVLMERLYPGSHIEIISSTSNGGGAQFFKEHASEYVLKYNADLLVIGGVSNRDNMEDFQVICDQVKANDLLTGRKTEILLLTNGWTSNAVMENAFGFSSDMRELDQVLENNAVIPDDYRGHLLKFAAANDIEYLDMMGIASEFVFGPAARANVGPPSRADGVPFSFWMRDWMHPDESGRQIMGRIFEAYFAPSGVGDGITPEMVSESHQRRPLSFDPQSNEGDHKTLEEAMREFKISSGERPIFAESFSRGSHFGMVGAVTKGGFAMAEPGKSFSQLNYEFDEELDVRRGEISVYWAFRANRSAGEDDSKVTMHLNFTDPPRRGHPEGAHLSLAVRPGSWSLLYVDPGWQMDNLAESKLDPPFDYFLDPTKVEKFRLVIRWVGGDRVLAEPSCWNPRSGRWEGFPPYERPGAQSVVMELSINKHLLGRSLFKSVFFQFQSEASSLDTVVVTVRPSRL